MTRLRTTLCAAAALTLSFAASQAFADTPLLNVSYDPTRELYQAVNKAFIEDWKSKTGEKVTIEMSHGGSSKQARAVIDGLEADVVTLGLEADIDAIAEKTGKIPKDWKTRLPNNSAPYTSTIVFVVRKGNPKGIKDWDDVVKPGVQVITPNPKTSGNGKWSYLGAWAYASLKFGGDQAKTRDFITTLYKNVPVLDSGARGSTTTFAQRGVGDVHLTWENEAFLELRELGADNFEIIVPSVSVDAVPNVSVVDGNADAHGTRKVAEAYLNFLYTPEAQKIIAKNFYRPFRPEAADPEDLKRFPKLKLISIDDPIFGGWAKVQPTHFDDGGIFDQIYQPKSTN